MNRCTVEIGIDAGEMPEDYRCCLEDGHEGDHVIQTKVWVYPKGIHARDQDIEAIATIIVHRK